jgi:nucleoside-diphosphate-sugar epimerase
MRVFLTGASGYIGGSIAHALLARGDQVAGLTRTREGAAALKAQGIEPVVGSLKDWDLLIAEAHAADAVINAADADDPYAVSALLTGLRGTAKTLLHTSGTSVVGDMAAGEPSPIVHTEDSYLAGGWRFEKAGRVAIDRAVLAAADGVRAIVVCPSMIYGTGTGLHRDSVQVPGLMRVSRLLGAGVHVGRGENRWSNVHIADLVDLYLLALDLAPAGSFFFAENGEASLKDIATAISHALGLQGRTRALSLAEALEHWPPSAVHYSLASNVRVTSAKARGVLGWQPRHRSILDSIAQSVS